MKTKYFLSFTILILLLNSCAFNLVEKRKHLSGFHWRGGSELLSGKKNKKNEETNDVSSKIKEKNKKGVINEVKQEITKEAYTNIDSTNSKNTSPPTPLIQEKSKNTIVNITKNKTETLIKQSFKKQKKTHKTEKIDDSKMSFLMVGMGSFITLLGILYIKKNTRQAKVISFWALFNPKKARTIIAALQLSIGLAAYEIGTLLKDIHVVLPNNSDYIFYSIGIGAISIYPFKKHYKGVFKQSYFKQKLHDAVLVFSGFGLILSLGNQNNSNFIDTIQFNKYSKIEKSDLEPVKIQNELAKNDVVILKTVILLVLFLGSFVMACLLAYLSCSIICSGYPIIGYALFFSGVFSILFAYTIVSRKIIFGKEGWKKPKSFWLFFILTSIMLLALLLFGLDVSFLTLIFAILGLAFLMISILIQSKKSEKVL